MLRSMFAGVSGLRSHQAMMDVVGNNIANVNTSGFKASRATFQEALAQVARGATAAVAGNVGGINAMQIGLGAQLGAVDQIFTQGATQLTGRPTDVAIDGDGFFVVNLGGQQMFSRAGAFGFDANGALVGPSGEQVIDANTGAPIQIAGLDAYDDIAIGNDGVIRGRQGGQPPVELAQMAIATFANPGGLERQGGGLFLPTANSGAPNIGAPGEDGRGGVQAGTLEMSNVDLAQEFTNLIMAQRGFQANSRTITTSDELLQELVNLKR
jgi:flagellar hook protein FlgE